MLVVNMHAAKTQLSALIKRAEAGEKILIARHGVPVVHLVPLHGESPKRVFGALKGRLAVTPAFFEPLPDEELADWGE
jgi:prevent-host-death family protein